MALKPEEVSSVLEQELERYESRLKMESVGRSCRWARNRPDWGTRRRDGGSF